MDNSSIYINIFGFFAGYNNQKKLQPFSRKVK